MWGISCAILYGFYQLDIILSEVDMKKGQEFMKKVVDEYEVFAKVHTDSECFYYRSGVLSVISSMGLPFAFRDIVSGLLVKVNEEIEKSK